jgi:LmbE family N-acetylglucosaminyl deacetylase
VATVLAFHAHPDDEVLLTGGTLARLASEGHRVVVVVACAGGLGTGAIANPETRLTELRASAAQLGVARVVHLGYADSGHGPVLYPDPPGQVRFARADLAEAAAKLAGLIRTERADVLLSYPPHGGNGHRDHVRVHQVGARAAELAGPVRVLEAVAPRELLAAYLRPARALRLVHGYDDRAIKAGTPRSAITHRIDVRRFAARKQAALAAHRTQVYGQGRSARLFRLLVALPASIFGLICGREWFVEVTSGAERLGGRGALADDIFQCQPEGGGQRGDGEEGGRGDAPRLDLAQRFRGNARRGGDLGHAPRPARLTEQHAEPGPARVLQAAKRRSDHSVILIPVLLYRKGRCWPWSRSRQREKCRRCAPPGRSSRRSWRPYRKRRRRGCG